MFRIHLDAGYGKTMVIELAKRRIHYFNQVDELVAVMGPLDSCGYVEEEVLNEGSEPE